jgi:hypothetical protein
MKSGRNDAEKAHIWPRSLDHNMPRYSWMPTWARMRAPEVGKKSSIPRRDQAPARPPQSARGRGLLLLGRGRVRACPGRARPCPPSLRLCRPPEGRPHALSRRRQAQPRQQRVRARIAADRGGAEGMALRGQRRPCRQRRQPPVASASCPTGPKDRHLELAPKYWPATRARLDARELAAEFGPLTVPAPTTPAQEQPPAS